MTKHNHITPTYYAQPYQQLKYHTPYALKKMHVYSPKKNGCLLKKRNTRSIGLSAQAQRDSYMGTKKNDNLKILLAPNS